MWGCAWFGIRPMRGRNAHTPVNFPDSLLPGENDIENLLAITRLLRIGDLTPSVVGNSGLGNFVPAHGIVGSDIL